MKRKSISFEDSATSAKTMKPTKAAYTARNPSVTKPKFGGSAIYAPPQGKYSSNVGKFGKPYNFIE